MRAKDKEKLMEFVGKLRDEAFEAGRLHQMSFQADCRAAQIAKLLDKDAQDGKDAEDGR